ncbi:hypothetical protein T492DRAFT_963368 [Pavlovales sp. CCMP2436]|nr:hypothetical protein T492DRAFT_963368 [Pavlovales sp. CCMP2436]
MPVLRGASSYEGGWGLRAHASAVELAEAAEVEAEAVVELGAMGFSEATARRALASVWAELALPARSSRTSALSNAQGGLRSDAAAAAVEWLCLHTLEADLPSTLRAKRRIEAVFRAEPTAALQHSAALGEAAAVAAVAASEGEGKEMEREREERESRGPADSNSATSNSITISNHIHISEDSNYHTNY